MEKIILIVLGLSVGSFLNVVIYRLPRKENLAFPRSRCPACGLTLRWYHNIPILSFLLLRGRCAGCGKRISFQYPLVEALSALMFWLSWHYFGADPLLAVFSIIFLCILLVLTFVDLELMILPDELTLGGGVLFLAFAFFHPRITAINGIATGLGGALVFAAIFFFYLKVRKIEGLGFGDVKLMVMLGAFLGMERLVVAILLASFSGLLVGVFFILFRGKDLKMALPFGPFLSLGAFLSLFWGDAILMAIQGLVALR